MCEETEDQGPESRAQRDDRNLTEVRVTGHTVAVGSPSATQPSPGTSSPSPAP